MGSAAWRATRLRLPGTLRLLNAFRQFVIVSFLEDAPPKLLHHVEAFFNPVGQFVGETFRLGSRAWGIKGSRMRSHLTCGPGTAPASCKPSSEFVAMEFKGGIPRLG